MSRFYDMLDDRFASLGAIWWRAVASVALAVAALLLTAGVAAAATPEWKLTVTPSSDYILSGNAEHPGAYKVEAENIGGKATSGEVKLEDILPEGLSATGVHFYDTETGTGQGTDLHEALCPTLVECKFPGLLQPSLGIQGLKRHERLIMVVRVAAASGIEGPLRDVAKISGGGAPSAEADATNIASSDPPFGLLDFDASLTDSSKTDPYTQAGGHPYQFITEFNLATYSATSPGEDFTNGQAEWFNGANSVRDAKNITAELPPGLIANPQGVPHCSLADYFVETCSRSEDTVGSILIRVEGSTEGGLVEPLYNLQPEGAYPGQIGGTVLGLPFIMISAGIRSGSDYGVSATSVGPEASISLVRLNLWGVPADEAHNAMRGKGPCILRVQFKSNEELEQLCEDEVGFGNGGGPANVPPTPFLTMPTECSGNPLLIRGSYDSWQVPGEFAEDSVEFPAVDGCNVLSFEPTIEARPTTNLADAPSGLEFNLHVPQNEDPEGVATPELKEAVVKLPKGIAINPASGEGLTGCTEAQIGLHSEESAHCPDASKLGTVEVHSVLLNEPLSGFLYLATPHQNPSGALLAGYLVVEGQGIRIKLPGSFETDPQTGQITTKFLQNPQLPFEDLKLDLFGGARGALRTPAVCGSYETTSSLTPFSAPESGPPATPAASFTTTTAENGGTCPTSSSQLPNKPVFRAGTETPQAGIYSPFSLKLVREDGSQEITSIQTTLPPGLVGKLAGIPYCPEAGIAQARSREREGGGAEEQASPSCPASSEVGKVDIGAGAGPTPINVPGHVYLAGPYKGAPISLAIITPALAGPFDLGTVVVRTALYVNPETTQIHAVSDPIPTILEGIPLDVRSITLNMARPNFTLNPTSCEESAFTGSAFSVLGSLAPLSQRFQVGGCPALAFKPKLALALKGGTKRSDNPALTATLTMPPGGANVATAQVTLPHSEFLDQSHIRTICTNVQFNADACPAASIYGKARATTPLLDKPLEGPVYLRSSSHELPDLVADLNGQLNVVLDGRIDSIKGGIRTTFEAVPDAPVSKFTLEMQGGKKGLLENSTNICKSTEPSTATFTAHNGKSQEANPLLKVRCPKHAKKHKRHHNRAARRHAAG